MSNSDVCVFFFFPEIICSIFKIVIMTLIKNEDPLVSKISLYIDRHWLLHAYVLPFFVLYGIWIQAWLFSDFYGHSVEAGLIFLAVVFLLQVLMALACHWSVHVMALVTCSKVKKPSEASFAKFVPTANNGSAGKFSSFLIDKKKMTKINNNSEFS